MKTEYRELTKELAIMALSLFFTDTAKDKKLIEDYYFGSNGEIIVKVVDNTFKIKRLTKE